MLTPIQEAIENIEKYVRIDILGPKDIYDRGYLACLDRATAVLNSLLPKEKKVIEDAFESGVTSEGSMYETGEDYYNEIFNNEIDQGNTIEDNLEWLDESEPSYGLEDMRSVFNLFNNYLAQIAGISFGDNMFTEYLKDKYNIDL